MGGREKGNNNNSNDMEKNGQLAAGNDKSPFIQPTEGSLSRQPTPSATTPTMDALSSDISGPTPATDATDSVGKAPRRQSYQDLATLYPWITAAEMVTLMAFEDALNKCDATERGGLPHVWTTGPFVAPSDGLQPLTLGDDVETLVAQAIAQCSRAIVSPCHLRLRLAGRDSTGNAWIDWTETPTRLSVVPKAKKQSAADLAALYPHLLPHNMVKIVDINGQRLFAAARVWVAKPSDVPHAAVIDLAGRTAKDVATRIVDEIRSVRANDRRLCSMTLYDHVVLSIECLSESMRLYYGVVCEPREAEGPLGAPAVGNSAGVSCRGSPCVAYKSSRRQSHFYARRDPTAADAVSTEDGLLVVDHEDPQQAPASVFAIYPDISPMDAVVLYVLDKDLANVPHRWITGESKVRAGLCHRHAESLTVDRQGVPQAAATLVAALNGRARGRANCCLVLVAEYQMGGLVGIRYRVAVVRQPVVAEPLSATKGQTVTPAITTSLAADAHVDAPATGTAPAVSPKGQTIDDLVDMYTWLDARQTLALNRIVDALKARAIPCAWVNDRRGQSFEYSVEFGTTPVQVDAAVKHICNKRKEASVDHRVVLVLCACPRLDSTDLYFTFVPA